MNEQQTARLLAEEVSKCGGRAYFVGGCVRDRLMQKESKDWDIEVHGIDREVLEKILGTLGECLFFGESFGVYGLKGLQMDIALPRTETANGHGHRDFDISINPLTGLEKAARRRDFTVNALLQDVLTGEIFDFFHGREDLENRVLRAVSAETFPEDPLRVLRAAQFASRFSFSVAPETASLCRSIDLRFLAPERVETEMKKALLQAKRPSVFFSFLREINRLDVWFPELLATVSTQQSKIHHPEGDVFTHSLLVLDEAAACRERAENPYALLLAALTHDFGKPLCTTVCNGIIRSIGHEKKGVPMARAFLHRLKTEKRVCETVCNHVSLHMRPNMLPANASLKASNRLFDESMCPNDLLLLARCDSRGCLITDTADKERFLSDRLSHYRETMAKPFVQGRDLIAAGLTPNERFSELLSLAHRLRLADVPKNKALKQVLAYASQNGIR